MHDYEDIILDSQESEEENCTHCPYKGEKCKSQCLEIKEVYNPFLFT